jgi:hypothetical protein
LIAALELGGVAEPGAVPVAESDAGLELAREAVLAVEPNADTEPEPAACAIESNAEAELEFEVVLVVDSNTEVESAPEAALAATFRQDTETETENGPGSIGSPRPESLQNSSRQKKGREAAPIPRKQRGQSRSLHSKRRQPFWTFSGR